MPFMWEGIYNVTRVHTLGKARSNGASSVLLMLSVATNNCRSEPRVCGQHASLCCEDILKESSRLRLHQHKHKKKSACSLCHSKF